MLNRIAVLLTVYNRKESTIKCLRNLQECELPVGTELKVYLTNDGCTDGTPEAVRQEFPEVHIIEGDGTLYWNRGMIAAWKEAAKEEFDYYLWLNDDTYIYKDVIVRLLNSSEKHDNKAVIVGATCAVGNTNEITYGGWRGSGVIKTVNKEEKCDTFNGNIVLVPSSVYELIGTNDPRFRHAAGDTDYGLTANEIGIEVWQAEGLMGECDKHERPAVWMNPSQPFKKRWKNFYSPIGNNPFEYFYFRKKHYGLIPACVTFVSNHVHFLFPWLWPSSYKEYKQK